MSEYLEDQLNEEELKNWRERTVDDPIKARALTQEEIEQLKKEGRI
jgi:hypothetical protein